jgi:hypothetical protein
MGFNDKLSFSELSGCEFASTKLFLLIRRKASERNHLYRALILIEGKGFVRNLRYGTLISLVQEGFTKKPLLRYLCLNCYGRVRYKTSLFTKPKRDLHVYPGRRTFLDSVPYLFF